MPSTTTTLRDCLNPWKSFERVPKKWSSSGGMEYKYPHVTEHLYVSPSEPCDPNMGYEPLIYLEGHARGKTKDETDIIDFRG